MIFIDEMKNMKIYKKQFFLPYNDKDKKHGSLVYLLSPNYASSRKLINSPLTINRRYFESYYFERNATYYINSGKIRQEELLEEAIEEQRDSAIHNGFDYEAFDEYMLSKGEPGETPTYYESIKTAILSNKFEDGKYNVYVHPVNHSEIPTYIGRINITVTSDALYDAVYKWIDWEDIEDEGEYIEEGIDETYIIPKDNLEINLDLWKPGTPLYITGSSGDGKSTLAYNMAKNKSNVIIVSTDTLLSRICWPKEKWDSRAYKVSAHNPHGLVDVISKEYIESHQNLPYCLGGMNKETGKHKWPTSEAMLPYFKNFFDYVEKVAKTKYKNNLIIIEGCDICLIEPAYFKDKPIIIIGGSNLRNLINRAKRETYHDTNLISNIFKEIKKYRRSVAHLDSEKWDFYNKMQSMDESYFANEKDIYYNKDKFDSGEINLCFITGHSGAGKSTMARDMSSKKVEMYELDDVIWNKEKFTMENFKEYGDLIYSFFKGPGKDFYYTAEDVKNGLITKTWDNYEDKLTNLFVNYAKSYAKAHKDTKFVIEGVWLVDFCKPEDFKDYAFYIKGTSVLISRWRAAKRDSRDAGDAFAQFRARVRNITNPKLWKPNWDFEKDLKKFRDYFINLSAVQESTDLINESKYHHTNLYFISEKDLGNKYELSPRIPDNYLTKNGYEDNTTPRVCFSNSINGCLIALSQNLKGKEFFVYQPSKEYKFYSPTIKEVPDARITGEKWINEKVKIHCIGKILVDEAIDSPLPYTYGDNKIANLYAWDWKWINKITEQTDPLDNDYTYTIENRYNVQARDRSDNACVKVRGFAKPMRGRSSIAILKEVNRKLCVFCDFIDKDGSFSKAGDITLPGGGWNPDETPRDAAIREAGEETLMAVKDVMHCGCHIEYSDNPDLVCDWVKEHVPEDNWWYGYYSEVFVGMYDQPYKADVAPEDLDDIAEKGKWIPIEDLEGKEPKDYLDAIYKYIEIQTSTLEEAFYEPLIDSLLEISKVDEAKNKKLEPVFVINTYTGSPFGRVIQSVNHSEFSHTLISFTPSLRKMYSFDFGKKVIDNDLNYNKVMGFCVDNIDRYRAAKIQNIEVFVLMVPMKVKLALEKSVDWYKANVDKTAYGFTNLFDYLRGSKKLDSFGELKMFCSEFVDALLKSVNIDISGHTSRNSAPVDMGHYTDANNFYLIFKGRAVDYSEEEIIKKIDELRATVPYKKLNAVSKKYIKEDADAGAPGVVDAKDMQKSMKNFIRRLKMKAKRGIYNLNKNRRSIDSQLPTADSIQNSVNTNTPSTTSSGGSENSEQEAAFLREVVSATKFEDINSFYMNEDAVYIFTEGEKRFDSPLRKIIWNDRLKANKEVILLYNKVKAEIPSIKYTYIQGERYQNRNLWYDLSFYTELFFKNNTFKLDKAVDLYFDFMSRMLEPARVPGNYTKRTIFIPVIDWNDNVMKKTWLYRDGINPISVIFRMMGKNMSKVKALFKDMDIIFFGNDNYFKINFSTLTQEEEKQLILRFKTYINKMTSNIPFNVDEIDPSPDNQESEKVIVTNIVDKIEKAQKVNMSTQSGYIPSAVVTAKAFTGKPAVRPVAVSAPSAKVPVTNTEIKKEIKKEEDQAEKIMKATTTSNDLSKEAKQQKQNDIQAKEKAKKEIIDRISSTAKSSTNTDDAIENLEDDQVIKDLIIQLASEEDAGIKINKARMDRMAQLNAEFREKEIRKGVKIKDILDPEYQKKAADEPLPSTTIKVDSPFADEWKDLKYINFDKTYDINEDIMKMLNALSEKQYPISIRNYKIENTSTSEDYIDTYTIEMEDFRGKRFTIKLDIPKFKDNKYLILRGNKKTIQNQYFNMPILKTDVDTVQIISNYNKIFIRRFGNTKGKTISYADRLIKALNKYEGNNIKTTPGDNSKIGNAFDLPIDYIDLGSLYNTIEFKSSSNITYTVYFNPNTVKEKYKDLIDPLKGLAFGTSKNGEKIEIMYYPKELYATTPFSLFLVQLMTEEVSGFEEIFNATNMAKKYVYSQASILNQRIPLIIVCAMSEGLLSVLKKANIQYELIQSLPRDYRHSLNKDWIKFSDGYLVYDITYDSSMLLNGLKEADTESYSIDEINTRRMYIEMLDDYGGRIISDGIDNFYECMIDPITKEVLEHYKLPTDYTTLLVYANALLSDNSYISHGDSSSRRIRKNELIAVKVYKALFNDAYSTYANDIRHDRNRPFAIKQSAVIDKFMSDTISSDLSVGNCLNDIETINSVTTKGDSGMNSARSYTLDKRIYDKSMVNILGMSTGFAGTVGVTRQATINMSIDGKRGYTKSIEGDTSKMNTANTLTMTEALNPMGSTHDDPVRVAMTFVQTAKHQVRTKKSDPLLVTNGSDAVLPYVVSELFCKKAKENGTVKELVPDKYLVVTYDSGENEYIDLSNRIEKNSDGGFFVTVRMTSDLKEGQKVSRNQILAYDPDSFSKGAGETKELVYDVGKLAKVAIINSDDNFEDSAMVTSKLADDLATDVVIKEERILDANTNIYNWLKVGTEVQQEDILYETQTAYEEEDVNLLLKSLAGDEEQISKLGRRPVKSPVTGRIIGIKVYRTCELEDMSENMRKFFKENEAESKATLKKLESLGINDPTLTGSAAKLSPIGKLKNCDNCVLIEYYLQYHDIVSLGDKISYWSANKGVVHTIVPSDLAPYTDFRPKEEISAFTGISSINKRQIASNVLIGSLNKLVIELGRSVRDILGIPEIENEIDI